MGSQTKLSSKSEIYKILPQGKETEEARL